MSLFVSGKKPLKFFMESCKEKEPLRNLIESNGGKFSRRYDADTIELVPFEPLYDLPPEKCKRHSVFSYKYIEDSLTLNELQELSEYELGKPQKPVQLKASRKPPSKGRRHYTKTDEQKMQDYFTKAGGQANNAKYWQTALEKGLDVDHTPDSLKYHWAKVMRKREHRSREPEVKLPNKRLSYSFESKENLSTPRKYIKKSPSVSPRKEERTPSSSLKVFSRSPSAMGEFFTPKSEGFRGEKISEQFENYRAIKVTVGPQGREVKDYGDLKTKSEKNRISENFEKLVQKCEERSRRKVTEVEVLKALLERKGHIQKTIRSFRR